MTPAERLADIEWNVIHTDVQSANDMYFVKNVPWLIDRVKKLTEALEDILEKNQTDPGIETLKEEFNVRAARTYEAARKALEDVGDE